MRLLGQWWKFGDQQETRHFLEILRWGSRESNREELRHLLLYFALHTLEGDDKSLRHFFARDVLYLLEHGDTQSQYLSNLIMCERGVGRFNELCVKALQHLTDHVNVHHVWFAAMGGIETLKRCQRKKKGKT